MSKPPGGLFFGPLPPAHAAGAILAHAVAVGGVRWAKGRVLSAVDAHDAAAAGIAALTVARPGADDVGEDDAAAALADALTGSGVRSAPPGHGRVNLIAAVAGVLRVDARAVAAVNAGDERLTLGTLGPDTRVAAGEVVATIKIIPFAVPAPALARAVAAAAPLRIAAFAPRRFVLIQSRLTGTNDKLLAKTDTVTRARITALGSRLDAGWTECAHDAAALTDALRAAPADAVVLIAGAAATADRRDVIPAAIVAAGGRIERLGMPVDPGNLLCLGDLAGRPVIGLPGCARSPKRNGFDLVVERIAAGLSVASATIAAMGSGGLLPEAERPQPRLAAATPASAGTVGAIVLAAGRSTRMGATNKLLADLGGKPVIAHTLDALAAAGLPPPVVVTGYMAAEIAAAVVERPATLVVAADFAAGMSASLAAGLGAAPADWTAALIVLGDMPVVDPATLAALAAAADDTASVIVPVFAGRRGNPVAWGRAHWPRLMALTGDSGARSLLATVAITEVEVDDGGIVVDVDTPEALAVVATGAAANEAVSPVPIV